MSKYSRRDYEDMEGGRRPMKGKKKVKKKKGKKMFPKKQSDYRRQANKKARKTKGGAKW